MDFLLKASVGSARGEYLDRPGLLRSFDMNGTLLFRKPRDLYLQLSPIVGSL